MPDATDFSVITLVVDTIRMHVQMLRLKGIVKKATDSWAVTPAIIAALTLAGLLLSFGSQILISARFGTSGDLDNYLLALSFALVTAFHFGPLRDAVTPVFFERWGMSRESAKATIGGALSLAVAFMALTVGVVVVAIYAGPTPVTPAFLACFAVLLPGAVFYGLSETLNGLLAAFDMAVAQQGVRLAQPLCIVAALLLLPSELGGVTIAAGWSIGQAILFAIQAILLWRQGLRLSPRHFKIRIEPKIQHVAGALLGSYFIGQFYALAERLAFTAHGPGALSAYNYATVLVNVLVSIIVISVSNAVHPSLLRLGAVRNSVGLWELVTTSFQAATFAFCLIGCVLWVLAPEVVRVLFARGRFDAASVQSTSTALRFTLFVVPPIAFMLIAGRALLAVGDRWATAVSGVTVAIGGLLLVAMAHVTESLPMLLSQWALANLMGSIVLFLLLARRLDIGAAAIVSCLKVIAVQGLLAIGLCALALPFKSELAGSGDMTMIVAVSLVLTLCYAGATFALRAWPVILAKGRQP